MTQPERSELRPTVLVADDEPNVRESFLSVLEDDYRVIMASGGEEALKIVAEEHVDLVLLDIRMPDIDGMEVLRMLKEADGRLDVIMVTGIKDVRTAVQAMKLGAYDYLPKPFDVDELAAVVEKVLEKRALEREVACLRAEVERKTRFDNLIGSSPAMQSVFDTVAAMAASDATVLISGESGTGKEQVARAIHFNSRRKGKPFVAVDCAALPETLLESELFGHEKGAFTGASEQRMGKFELAAGGTLFLDEIGNLKLETQAKLLRALQEREVQRVGGSKSIKVDIRVISATNIDPAEAVKKGAFREDLYYRLNVVPVHVPPLRERKQDIPGMLAHFLKGYNDAFGKDVKGMSERAMHYLMDYRWPGNVRELKNLAERVVALSDEEIVSHESLPLDILLAGDKGGTDEKDEGVLLREARDRFERDFIQSMLERTGWNQVAAAKMLGIHRNTLAAKMRDLDVKPRKQ